ncbi:hypothetical protein BC629DRAFT_1595397 [Irpex lacteus]|nr:hypothetical protein BC629DRAFT_1595397 [Irpex lacteus]
MSKKHKLPQTEFYTLPADAEDVVPTLVTDNGVSRDGRRVKRKTLQCYSGRPTGSSSRSPLDDSNDLWNDPHCPDNGDPDETIIQVNIEGNTGRQFATETHDHALNEWTKERQLMLHELLRGEGLAGVPLTRCPACPPDRKIVPTYRCEDCLGGALHCREIERWEGTFFKPITLRDMGLMVQLGHIGGEPCRASVMGPRSFMVIDVNGIHPVNQAVPATLTDPTTCATFAVLEHFHITTLQSKITAYDYYSALEKLTDNTGLGIRYDRIKSFFRMVREWRHLKGLKRSGRGHEMSGVRGTKPGDLCLHCPACPRPGYNLPDNWETVSDDLKYIYTLFVAIDANFRLKRRARSNETRDPTLTPGWGYFVEDEAYRAYLRDMTDQSDISTCTGFAALMHANTKFSKGYATTGVAMVVCARHGFVLPNGIGDLQKGERFCNVDYIWASAMSHVAPRLPKVTSYDIACQWEPNLLARLQALPEHIRIEIPEGSLRYAIPKYHFMGHKSLGHHLYSLHVMQGVGRTDGEQIEREWSFLDALAASIREMGPGSRHDTIQDHLAWINWLKMIGLGKLLWKRLKQAKIDAKYYAEEYQDFKDDLQEKHVKQWTEEVVKWENNTKLTDPYDLLVSGPSEIEVRAQLAVEEEKAVANDGSLSLHAVTQSGMLAGLLEIEEQQRRVRARYPRDNNLTAGQLVDVSEKRINLRRRITALRPVQAIYMPIVSQLAAQHDAAASSSANKDKPEHQPLYLPSSLTQDQLSGCMAGLVDMEMRLRKGQMRGALALLRTHLHDKSRMVRHKARNVRHQRPNTRAQELLNTHETKIIQAAEKYRAAWTATKSKLGPGAWMKEWRELKKTDVRCLQEDDGHVVQSEGRRTVSWIWKAADGQGGEGLDEDLRVSFLKSRARAQRFAEEVQILQEEQRRVLVSLSQMAATWQARAEQAATKESPILRQGAIAYAARQQDLYQRLRTQFSQMWTGRGLASAAAGGEAVDEDVDEAGDVARVIDQPLYTIDQDSDEENGLIRMKGDDSDDEL